MTRAPRPNLTVLCPVECSYTEEKIGADKAEKLRVLAETGVGSVLYARGAEVILGYRMPPMNANRHMKHYRDPEPDARASEVGKKVGDLEILDDIIAAGARNSRSWRPTIKDTLDAMKLKAQLTGNSAFEDMLAAMDQALDRAGGDPERVGEAEARDALGLPDEQGDSEELAEPLVG